MKIEEIEKIKQMKVSQKDAVEMILSGCADIGSGDGCLISVKAFPKTAEALMLYFNLNTENHLSVNNKYVEIEK